MLCIRRTLADGWASGLVSGLGAASADAIYGSIAGFGLAFISNFLVSQQLWLRLIGGVFLCILGVRTLLVKPAEQASTGKDGGLLACYASTFFLTLTNPIDDHFIRGDFCRPGVGSRQGELWIGGNTGLGSIQRFCGVVAPVEQRGRHIPGAVQTWPVTMGQPDLRCDHYRIWNICPREHPVIKLRQRAIATG